MSPAALPRLVHTIWYQGASAVPPEYEATLDALRAANPGWTVLVHAHDGLRRACEASGVRAAYDAATRMHQRIDLGRYAVLWLFGGVTCDLDVDVLRGFEALPGIDAATKLSVSRLPLTSAEAMLVTHLESSQLFNNACLVGPAADAAVASVLAHCADMISRERRGAEALNDWALVNNTTGPRAFTRALNDLPKGAFRSLDPRFFEPCLREDPYCRLHGDTILRHRHDGSWLERTKGFADAYFSLRHATGPHVAVVATVAVFLAALTAAVLALLAVLRAARKSASLRVVG